MPSMSITTLKTRLAAALAVFLVVLPVHAQEATLKKLNAQAVDLYRQAKYVEPFGSRRTR